MTCKHFREVAEIFSELKYELERAGMRDDVACTVAKLQNEFEDFFARHARAFDRVRFREGCEA